MQDETLFLNLMNYIKSLDVCSPEQEMKWYQYMTLYYLSIFDYEKCNEYIEQWPEYENDSLWLTRKAGCIAELGDISRAYLLNQKALAGIGNKGTSEDNRIRLLSLEGIVLYNYRISEGIEHRGKRPPKQG